MSSQDAYLVDEMLSHLSVTEEVVSRGKAEVRKDPAARYALEHAIELLAEASKKVSNSFKRANPRIDWKTLRELRHDVAHPCDIRSAPPDFEDLWRFSVDDTVEIKHRLRRPVFPKA